MIIKYLELYLTELIVLTNSMSPYLLLGFLFAGILHVFFKKERVAKLLGSKKVKSSIYASLIGVPLPLCSCGVIPTGISFYKNGASKGSTVSFLISTPQTGIDSILATYSMLGLPFAILRPFVAFVSGVFGGSLTNYIDKNKVEPNETRFYQNADTETRKPFRRMLHYAFVEFLQDIAKWLIVGLLLAALISLLLPPEFFQEYISNEIFSMLIILLASIPLYVCATGSIPIAAVLLMKGISPGAALVFLMAGPATNMATITVLGKVMGKKALFGYLSSIIGASLFFGFLIDQFLPREWFTSFMVGGKHGEHGLPFWLEAGSSILLIVLILNIYIQRILKRRKSGKDLILKPSQKNSPKLNGKYVYINVNGLDCNHCKSNIENGLGALEGIESVSADIDNSIVKIRTEHFNPVLVKETVESLGYKYQGQRIESHTLAIMEDFKISIKGMSCNHCKSNVENALKNISGIEKIDVNLGDANAVIQGSNINFDTVKKELEGIGFEYGGIE